MDSKVHLLFNPQPHLKECLDVYDDAGHAEVQASHQP